MKIVTNKEYADPFVYFNGIQAGSNWTYENPAVYDPSVGHITQSLAFYGFTSPSQYFILSVQGNVDYAMYATNGLYAHAKVYVYDYFNHSIDDIENLTNSMLQGELNETSTVLIRLEHPMMLLAVISPITGDYDSIGSPIQISFSNQPNEVNPEPHYIIDWGNRIDGSCWNVAGKVYASKCLSDMPRRYVPGYQKIPILTLGIYKKIILSDIEVTGSTDFADAFGDDESYDDYDVVHDMSFDYRYNNASVPEELRYQSFMCKIATSFYANDSGDYYFNISQCDKSYVILNGQSIFFEQSGSFISSVKEGYNDLTIYCNYLHSVDTPSEEYSKAYFDFYPSFSATYYIPNDWDYDKQLTASGILEGATVQRLYTGEDTLIESDHSVPLPFIACSDGITIGMDIMLLDEWIEPESSSSGESGSSSSSEESSSSGDESSSSGEESSSSEEESSSSSEDASSSSEEESSSSEEESSSSSEEVSSSSEDSSSGESSSSSEDASSSSELVSSSSSSEQSVYSSFDVTGTGVTLSDSNINLSDYQYNEDGLDLQVLPDGYKAISGASAGTAFPIDNYPNHIGIDGAGMLRMEDPAAEFSWVIDSNTTWAKVSGICAATFEKAHAYATKTDGTLWAINFYQGGPVIQQVGVATGWTAISGYSASNRYGNSRAFGICDGALYHLNGTTATRIGISSSWTYVTGFSRRHIGNSSSVGFGIAAGNLYMLSSTSENADPMASLLDSAGVWTRVSGFSQEVFTNGDYRGDLIWSTVYGIRDGSLMGIVGGYTYSQYSPLYTIEVIDDTRTYHNVWLMAAGTTSTESTGIAIGATSEDSSSSGEESSSSEEESSSSSEEESSSSSGEESSSSSEESSSSSEESSSSDEDLSGFTFNSFDISGTTLTQLATGVDIEDYQYNEDGLDLQVLPDGYKAISGASAGMSFPSDYYPYHLGIDGAGMLKMEDTAAEFSWVIDSDTTWAKVSGICAATDEETYAYATKTDGTLWAINPNEAHPVIQQVGVDGGWTDISGYSDEIKQVSAFGICDGGLYHLIGTTTTRIGISSSWTAVTGFSRSKGSLHTCLGFGIDDGNLYTLAPASPSADPVASLLDSAGVWTKISGFSQVAFSNGDYRGDFIWSTVYGIRDGSLMGIVGGYSYDEYMPAYTVETIDSIRTYHNVWLMAAGTTSTESTGIAISNALTSASATSSSSEGSGLIVYQGLIEPDGEISNWSTLLFHGRGIVIRRAGKNTITIETANDYQMASFNVPCGEWVGIFITFDSNVTTWFVDRKADAVHISNAHATSSEPLYVGFSLSDGGIDYLSSSDMYGEEFYVKNVIAINKLLKQNEINRLYNARA